MLNKVHLIPYIIEILEAQHHLLDEVDAMKAHINGSLTIATIPTLFNKVVPKALSKFNKDYPHINVKIFESDKDEIARLVQQINTLGLFVRNTIFNGPFSSSNAFKLF